MRKRVFWIIIIAAAAAVIIWGAVFYWDNLRGAWSSFRTSGDDIGSETDKIDLIKINTPRPNSQVLSPLIVEGEARGYWFFEASFPVRVLDGDGKELGIGIAQVQPDPATGEVNWMTEDFVPFRATVNFKMPQFETGTLVLEKDNPSGLPEHADQIEIPIKFGTGNASLGGGCFVGGCSGEICSDRQDVVSTCIWREEFACYKNARCERQPSGSCGWTETAELASCLNKTRAGE